LLQGELVGAAPVGQEIPLDLLPHPRLIPSRGRLQVIAGRLPDATSPELDSGELDQRLAHQVPGGECIVEVVIGRGVDERGFRRRRIGVRRPALGAQVERVDATLERLLVLLAVALGLSG
jgi:hypothetical protein